MKINCPLCLSDNLVFQKFESAGVYTCTCCKLEFVENQVYDPDYYHDYYNRFRNDPDSDSSVLRRKQYKIDANHFSSLFHSGSVLDVGCSYGGFIQELDQAGNYQLTGIDIDTSAIKIAELNTASMSNVDFINAELLKHNFERKFDCIIFRGTFQYLGAQFSDTIRYLQSLLTDNGMIFIYALPNSKSFLYTLLKEKWHLFNAVEHKFILNNESLTRIAGLFDFDIVELSYPYLETAYANQEKDYKAVQQLIIDNIPRAIPFWGNLIQCVMKKKEL